MEEIGRTVVFLSYGRKGRRCDIMKSGLIILLILDVIKSGKTEIRHHQQDKYPARETNYTALPWSTTTLFTELTRQVSEVSRFDRFNNDGAATWFGKFTDTADKSSFSSEENHSTESPTTESSDKSLKKNTKESYSDWKTRLNQNFDVFHTETGNGVVTSGKLDSVIDHFLPSSGERDRFEKNSWPMETSTGRIQVKKRRKNENTLADSSSSISNDWTNDDAATTFQSFNRRAAFNLELFGEPVSKLENRQPGENCVETVLDDFVVNDNIVREMVLTDKRELEKISEEMTMTPASPDQESYTNLSDNFCKDSMDPCNPCRIKTYSHCVQDG